jgi:hypothetical protein
MLSSLTGVKWFEEKDDEAACRTAEIPRLSPDLSGLS